MKYKINDIMVDANGYKRKVLAVVDNLYGLSFYNDYKTFSCWYTQEDVDEEGYTLDISEWEPEKNDTYYYISLTDMTVSFSIWTNNEKDSNRKKLNLVFQTRELAEKRLAEIVTFLKK